MRLSAHAMFLSGAFVLVLLLSGCGSPTQPAPTATDLPATATAPADEAEPEATEAAVATSPPSPTAEPTPTEPPTPVPPTATSEPTTEAETQSAEPAQAELVPIEPELEEYPVPPGSRPHDVAPAPDGGVWYTAQRLGELGYLDPATGETHHIPLGAGSAPHGVIVGPDGAPWITDGGLNAIVRVDPDTEAVALFPLPEGSGNANLNTATFDQAGVLWFTGQNGVYGRLDPGVGQVELFEAPRGRGPYGIATTPDGAVYYASLAGSHIARIDLESGTATPLDPPTPQQGARRVWSDSQGHVWVSEWNAGQLAMFDPTTGTWQEWRLPGDRPMAYAVYVDDQDMVWLSDFGGNALVRFDPSQETFEVFTLPSPAANVRQILGRPGEVWGAESGTDKLVVIRTAVPAEGSRGSMAAPAIADAGVPTPTLFDVAWEDRSIFRPGLIASERGVLEELPDATVYHLDIVVADDLENLQGRSEILYTNREAESLDEIYLRLFPNLAGGSTRIPAINVNDQPVEPILELRDSALRVPLAPALSPGEQVVIQLEFSVTVPGEGGNYGAFAHADGVLALAHFYPMIAVYDDEGWNVEIAPGIGDVVYADSSFYLARVSAPETHRLIASGVEVEREPADARQIVTFAAGPMRDFYLAASDRYEIISRPAGEITVNSYAPAELRDGNELTLDFAVNALESFDERFGPYPFTEFDLISTNTFALGIEYPGIVAILVDLYDRNGQVAGAPTGVLLEGVVAHEVAHQWFYSLIGNDQVDEPWLDEAMAQFATIVYYSDVYGPAGARGFRGSLERRWERVDGTDIPIGLPVREYSSQEYGAIVYGRGPLFIEALSEAMGPEVFEAFVQDYYQTFRWRIATGDQFKQLAEQHCGCDLTPLFEEWVYAEVTGEG